MVDWKFAALALLGSTALAGPALAEGQRGFTITARTDVVYDTNVARSSEVESRARGVKPEDTLVTPGVQVKYDMPLGRQSFFVNAGASHSFYDVNKNLDTDQINFSTGIRGRIGPCAPKLEADYNRGRNILENFITASTLENVVDTTTIGLDIQCVRNPGIGVTLGVNRLRATNSLKSIALNDFETTSGSIGFQYQRPALGTLSIFGQHSRTEFINDRGVALSSGYEVTSEGVSFMRKLGARIEGSVSAAYTEAAPLSPSLGSTLEKFGGWTYSGDVSYRPSSRLSLTAKFSKAVTPADFGQSFQITEITGASGTYKLGSRIEVGLNGTHELLDLAGGLPASVIGLTHSRSNRISGDVKYHQSRRLVFRLNADHESRKTNDTRFDYDADRIGLGVDVTL
jgi:outer membrane receptor protein involved in Fe transport